MTTIKQLLIAILWYGGAYGLFRYVAEFSTIQSVLLAFVSVAAIDGERIASKFASLSNPAFEPFWIRIIPNWYPICKEHGLLTDEEWQQWQERERTNPQEYSIFYDGIRFTVLSHKLYFSNDHNTFFHDLDFRVPVAELKKSDSVLSYDMPVFYIKRKIAERDFMVIEMGISTPESRSRSRHHSDDLDHIPLASIPESIFFGYAHPDASYKADGKVREIAQKQLTEFGWTKEEQDLEIDWPVEINHKYFRVSYDGI